MILQVRNLTGGYTKNHDILRGISFDISKGDAVGIIGLNGSGKSSLAKALMNILPYRQGQILFNGENISKNTTKELSKKGIALYMQGGRVFDELTMWENMLIAEPNGNEENIERIRNLFPPLRLSKSKLKRMGADKLSGGERSSLALSLAMCVLRNPQLLILDEPSAGLAPHIVNEMYESLNKIYQEEKLSIILIEQNIARCVEFCSTVNMLRNGKIVYSSDNKDIKDFEKVMFNYCCCVNF